MCALGAAQNAAGSRDDLEKTTTREDQTNNRSQNLGDDILSQSDSPTPKQFTFEGISGSMFPINFEKIYLRFAI
jgi:hypothetical protein